MKLVLLVLVATLSIVCSFSPFAVVRNTFRNKIQSIRRLSHIWSGLGDYSITPGSDTDVSDSSSNILSNITNNEIIAVSQTPTEAIESENDNIETNIDNLAKDEIPSIDINQLQVPNIVTEMPEDVIIPTNPVESQVQDQIVINEVELKSGNFGKNIPISEKVEIDSTTPSISSFKPIRVAMGVKDPVEERKPGFFSKIKGILKRNVSSMDLPSKTLDSSAEPGEKASGLVDVGKKEFIDDSSSSTTQSDINFTKSESKKTNSDSDSETQPAVAEVSESDLKPAVATVSKVQEVDIKAKVVPTTTEKLPTSDVVLVNEPVANIPSAQSIEKKGAGQGFNLFGFLKSDPTVDQLAQSRPSAPPSVAKAFSKTSVPVVRPVVAPVKPREIDGPTTQLNIGTTETDNVIGPAFAAKKESSAASVVKSEVSVQAKTKLPDAKSPVKLLLEEKPAIKEANIAPSSPVQPSVKPTFAITANKPSGFFQLS